MPMYASARLFSMKIAANSAVARDSAVRAPRAPNTVPDAPAPKPAPASAPLPRWISTSAMIAIELKTCRTVRAVRNIRLGPRVLPATRGRQDRQKFFSLERGAPDQSTIHIGHREQLGRIAGLDAAAIEDARRGRDSSIA